MIDTLNKVMDKPAEVGFPWINATITRGELSQLKGSRDCSTDALSLSSQDRLVMFSLLMRRDEIASIYKKLIDASCRDGMKGPFDLHLRTLHEAVGHAAISNGHIVEGTQHLLIAQEEYWPFQREHRTLFNELCLSALSEGDYQTSVTLCAANDETVNNTISGILYARALMKSEQWTQAKAVLEETISRDLQSVEPRYLLAIVYRNINQNHKAAFILKAIIEEHPGYGPAYLELSRLHVEQGNIGIAAQVLEEAANVSDDGIARIAKEMLEELE